MRVVLALWYAVNVSIANSDNWAKRWREIDSGNWIGIDIMKYLDQDKVTSLYKGKGKGMGQRVQAHIV